MLILRHCHLSSEDLITCERALIRFVAGRAKPVNLEFNVWDYTLPEIYGYILGMFVKLELVDCLGISTDELLDFIIDVDHGYQATFYHSFYHAADVTAVLYHMLEGMCASQYLSKPDMAALLLAGLCHDIGHPGLNNLYQINAKTELLKEYGEASVLEKYSCSLAMNLVTKHSLFCNIAKSPLAQLPEGQSATDATMRDAMVKAILATDMTFHYNMLNNLNNLVEATTCTPSTSESEDDEEFITAPSTPTSIHGMPMTSGNRPKSKSVSMASPLVQSTTNEALESAAQTRSRSSSSVSNRSQSSQCSTDAEPLPSPRSPRDPPMFAPEDLTPEQRQDLCNCLLHAADISNAVKPWVVCKRWSDLVVQEFFRQGDIEKAQNLTVSPNMDRNQDNQPQISLGFGDYVVQPYFEALVDLLPEAEPLLKSLASNREQWVALQKSSQLYGHDPYLSVDPLEDPSMPSRPTSPGLPPMLSGRRVSVAAGVLVLDDAMILRNSHRKMRHSTNTELPSGVRRIKRSLSGRSLSTSMQNLHAHSTRSSQSSGKTHHGILISALKRQASLTEKDMISASFKARQDQLDNLASEFKTSRHAQNPPAVTDQLRDSAGAIITVQDNPSSHKNNSSSGGSGSFRQKRLASLQVASQASNGVRQEYGDGYSVLKDENPSGAGHNIPNSSASTQDNNPGTAPTSSSQPQAGNRSSTPALMMNKIKYDWVMSPTLPEIPAESRFGCGPLDSVEESHS